MKTDKERMGQDMKYVIDSKTYETHIAGKVHLYCLLHQLAFLAGKVRDDEDMENLLDTIRRYGEIAEEAFDTWRIPGRYLVFGDRADLAELKATELVPLAAVLKEHDAMKKERAAAAHDPAYIISGSAFRMLVGKGVVVHTLGKVDGIQHLDPVLCPLQKLSYLANQAAFRNSFVKIENGSITDNFHFRNWRLLHRHASGVSPYLPACPCSPC